MLTKSSPMPAANLLIVLALAGAKDHEIGPFHQVNMLHVFAARESFAQNRFTCQAFECRITDELKRASSGHRFALRSHFAPGREMRAALLKHAIDPESEKRILPLINQTACARVTFTFRQRNIVDESHSIAGLFAGNSYRSVPAAVNIFDVIDIETRFC